MREINDRCPFQDECEQRQCEFKFHERDCSYYQGNARPGAEIEDQQQAMEAEWEARMSTPSVLDGGRPAELEASALEPAIVQGDAGSLVMLPVDKLFPHPDNPRKDLGDLTELADSIKTNGIMQNLTVVPKLNDDTSWDGESYTVIIGHRRLAAAKKAGLGELPCIVREMTEVEQVKTMLTENMQRTDLTVYEQAQGFQMMLDMGETVESIAKESGFSKTTVRRRVKLLELDADKFKKSEGRGATLQDYLELEKIENPELKNKVLDAIGTVNFRDVLKKAIEDEKHLRRMAQWETDLEAFALKIEKRDYVGETPVPMDYVRNLGRWSPKDAVVERPADAGAIKYYYRVSSGEIDIYKDHQEYIETEADRQRKAAREALEKREAELQEITERHFSLRQDFIMEFGQARKYLPQIIAFAINDIVGTGEWGRDDIDAEILAQVLDLNVDVENCDYETLRKAVGEVAAERPEYTLLACAYAAEDGELERYWSKEWDSNIRAYVIAYKPNDTLDILYTFLTSLGYEMSDEEKAMQDGTHELFHTASKTEEDPCALCKSAHPSCDKCCEVCDDHCNAWQTCRKA